MPMPTPATDIEDDEATILHGLETVRDYFRLAVSRFERAGLAYGHGATNALDEAAFIVLEGLRLPIDQLDPFLDARLAPSERRRLLGLISARIASRKPAAYLLNRAYIGGAPFYVDERVIVPRSYIGELLTAPDNGFSAMIGDPSSIASVLDLCTGGGSLAILAAMSFDQARIDATDCSPDALAVAHINIDEYDLGGRIKLYQGDLFAPVGDARYDLIVANPPYVDRLSLDAFPPEFAAEPRVAHDGGADGLDLVRAIVDQAARHLTAEGTLVCEVGHGRAALEAAYPELELIWLDTQESQGEVFLARARDLPGVAGLRRR